MTSTYRASLFALVFFAFEAALIMWVDRPLSEYARSMDASNHQLIDMFRATTDFAKSTWYLWPSGLGVILCAFFLRIRSLTSELRIELSNLGEKLLFFFLCVAASGIVTDIIKPIVGRARPVELGRDGIYGFSPFSFHALWNGMPSGHATTAFAVAGVLSMYYPKGRPLWFLVAVFFAASRVMVNAHFLSDTLAGAAIGILTVSVLRPLPACNRIFPVIKCLFPIDNPDKRS